MSTTTAAPVPPTTAGPDGECGVSANRNRIVGGTEARQGAWPWAVILGSRRGNSNSFQVMCGGSLLSPDTVLTAAHCFDRIPGQSGPDTVRLGDHDITTTADGASPVDISIARSVQHPGWDSNTLDNDIAIVKLSQSVSYTRNIRRVCLPDRYAGQNLHSLLRNPDPVIIGHHQPIAKS